MNEDETEIFFQEAREGWFIDFDAHPDGETIEVTIIQFDQDAAFLLNNREVLKLYQALGEYLMKVNRNG